MTTARSAGVSSYVDVGLRELVKRGHVAGPDLLAAGYHVRTQPAPELFLSDPDLGDLLGGVTTVDGLRRVVRANLSHGVDWIKVNATERAGTPDTDPEKADVQRRGAGSDCRRSRQQGHLRSWPTRTAPRAPTPR